MRTMIFIIADSACCACEECPQKAQTGVRRWSGGHKHRGHKQPQPRTSDIKCSPTGTNAKRMQARTQTDLDGVAAVLAVKLQAAQVDEHHRRAPDLAENQTRRIDSISMEAEPGTRAHRHRFEQGVWVWDHRKRCGGQEEAASIHPSKSGAHKASNTAQPTTKGSVAPGPRLRLARVDHVQHRTRNCRRNRETRSVNLQERATHFS